MALSAECIYLCHDFPGNRGYLCRQTFLDLQRSTLETFFNLVPEGIIRKHWRQDKLIEFWNGSEILYGGLGSQEDFERIKSTEFGFFAIDEATEAAEHFFLLLASRLRWKLPDGSYPRFHGLLASNPEPGWVKERFVDQHRKLHIFIKALPKDNSHLPEEYIHTLRGEFPADWVKRYLDGSWDHFEGQVYKEFDRDAHVYRNLQIGTYWTKIRVIDHGYTNPTCCLFVAADFDGNLWVYDEHYESQLTVEQNAAIIKAKDPHFKGITLIDPSAFAMTQVAFGKPCSIADEYRKQGIICISPYLKDGRVTEGVGINMVKQRLLNKSLKIHEDCVNGIHEIINLRWRQLRLSTRTGNESEQPMDKDNHFTDCLRYLSVWSPHGSRPPDPEPGPETLTYWINKIKHQNKAAKFAGWN